LLAGSRVVIPQQSAMNRQVRVAKCNERRIYCLMISDFSSVISSMV
jgi:hypothetical protein